MGKTRDPFKKIGDIKRTFHARMGTIKERDSKKQKPKRLRRGGKNTQKNYTRKVLIGFTGVFSAQRLTGGKTLKTK